MKTTKKETRTGEDFQQDIESVRNGSFFGITNRGVIPIQLQNGGIQHPGFAGVQPVAPYAWGIPPYVPAYGVNPYAPSLNPFQQVNPAYGTPYSQPVNHFFSNSLEFNPLVNISEDDEDYVIELVVPGYHNEDCKVKVKERVLYVYGSREETREDVFYTLKEYRSTYFERAFLLSDEIDSEEIIANCTNGILTLTLVKKSEEERQEKEIEITEEALA